MRILMVQRSLSPPGGGNAVAAWMVHALAGRHEIATLTSGAWSVAETNAFYGTSIPDTIIRHVIPSPAHWLSSLPEGSLSRLRMSSVLHYARPLSAQFDLLITADDAAPFVKPGIQYLHFPAHLQPKAAKWSALVNVYFAICDRVLGAQWTDAARNVTLVNSQWTATGLTTLGELTKPIVIYPPVIDPGPGLPWAQRDQAFLSIGRFHGTKRMETAIAIVDCLRARAIPDARLIIVGSPVDADYTARIRRLAAKTGPWIEFREDLSRTELNALMGRTRYGIQAMFSEHFGMATAEMARAGVLVFAHNSGGSPEVLNDERSLLWTTEEDAVERVSAIAANPAEAERLSHQLRTHAEKFSTEVFVDRFRAIVARS